MAGITAKYGQLIFEVDGVEHVSEARRIENILRKTQGIQEALVSESGHISLKFEKAVTTFEIIASVLEKQGLTIRNNTLTSIDLTIRPKIKEHESAKKRTQNKEDPLNLQRESNKCTHDHGHTNGGFFSRNAELIFSVISGVLLVAGFTLSFVEPVREWLSLVFYIGAYFFGGFYTAKEAFETILKGGFEIDFLMLVAAIGAAILGEWAEGALLLFLFSLGHALEHYAMNKARKSIAALANLSPKTALLKQKCTTEVVPVEALKIGDIILVKPHSRISADGVVVRGSSSVNEAPLTGESVPVEKIALKEDQPDSREDSLVDKSNRVFAGTINGNHGLEIRVTKLAKDSTLARMVQLVNEAQTQKSPTQRLTNKFEKYYVPLVLLLVFLLLFAFIVIEEPFSVSFYRAMAVLVAASPCALAISTPSAVLSGVARAARGGVLIKGGRPLEDLGELTALAFDKTGTLTQGKPGLTKIVPLEKIAETELLKIAVAVERLSDHPLAKAIVTAGKKRFAGLDLPEVSQLESFPGKGIKAFLGNDLIYIGNPGLFNSLDGEKPSEEISGIIRDLETAGNTTMLLQKNGTYIGVFAFMDEPRKAAKETLLKLKRIGIKRIVMLSGDNQKVADAVAQKVGITEAWGGLLPEEKVTAIKKLKKEESKVAMVGDGVNDAPAMAHSTVGIAMGAAGNDVALETADIALMANKLETLPFAIGLSRKAKAIIKQNLWVSLGIVVLLVPASIFGLANIGVAVVIHEGSTLLVVFNALRLLAYKGQ